VKVTVITAVCDDRRFIADCIRSVEEQSHGDIEHIIVDGDSRDGTREIIEAHRDKVSAVYFARREGVYNALNLGIKMATGDIIGFLHADDLYADNRVVEKVARAFDERDIEALYGDLVYVSRNDISQVVRNWRSGEYAARRLFSGWSLPHPTFYARKEVYEKVGPYDESLRISADYEMTIRLFLRHRIAAYYMPETMIKMRTGGISNRGVRNILRKMAEDHRAWVINGFRPSMATVLKKNCCKISQLNMAFFLEQLTRGR